MDNLNISHIKSNSELIDYLKIKGQNHNYYNHYTNFDSLIGITTYKYLHLASLANPKMNDLQEIYAKGSFAKREKIYAISFNYGNSENMAMWGLYSIPNDEGILITIPGKTLNKLIHTTKEIYEVKNKGDYHKVDSLADITIMDIAYVNGIQGSLNGKIFHYNKYIDIVDSPQLKYISTDPNLTGYIKNMAWAYENETRAIIELDKISTNSMAIKLTNDLIQEFTITFGPCVSTENKENIKNRVKLLGFDKIKFRESSFDGLVKYRSQCTYCEYLEFKRKVLP